jgi:hypothetical protein
VRFALLGFLVACAHPSPPVAHAPTAVVAEVVAEAEAGLDDAAQHKLPDYKPMPESAREAYITLTTDAPGSFERKAIESVAHDCLLAQYTPKSSVEITMTLDTRADGTLTDASYDGANMALGTCLTEGIAKVRLHAEGKREHVVVVVNAGFGTVWR